MGGRRPERPPAVPVPDKGPYGKGVGFNQEVFDHFQRSVAVRAALPALRTGDYETVLADDATGVFAFARTAGDDRVTVVLNRSGKSRAVRVQTGEGTFVDYLDLSAAKLVPADDDPAARPTLQVTGSGTPTTDGTMSLTLRPWQTMVLVKQK